MLKAALTSYYIYSEKFDHKKIRGVVGQDMVLTTSDYISYVYSAGLFPVIVTPLNDKNYINDIVKNTDILILSGGEDSVPELYNEKPSKYLGETVKRRDIFEINLIKAFLNAQKPVFGICRGFQLLNIYFGGTLYQDYREINENLSFHCEQPYQKLVHEVNLSSCLTSVFKTNKIKVNSHHHQFIKKIGKDLKIIAKSPEGIPEALENKEKKILAVQWHPEMLFNKDKRHLDILKCFIDKYSGNIE